MKNAASINRTSHNNSNIQILYLNKNRYSKFIESCTNLQSEFDYLRIVQKNIISKEKQIANFSDATLIQSASAIIWLQSTYDLNILQMTDGKLISNRDQNQVVKKYYDSESLYFEDLFLVSRAALEIELYAIAIKFLAASVIVHKKNKCISKTSDGKCRPYNFHSVQTRYIGKHNFALLNNSDASFDSAERFPFRITYDILTNQENTDLLLNEDHGASKR